MSESSTHSDEGPSTPVAGGESDPQEEASAEDQAGQASTSDVNDPEKGPNEA